MKRSLTVHVSSAGRSLRTLMTSATLLLALTAAGLVNAASAASAKDLFYTTSGAGYGFPNGAEIFAITVSGAKVTTRDIGPTGNDGCGSLALSPDRTLYSMCGPTFGTQQLATIDQNTGRASLFGVPVPGLDVMAMAFGPNGTLYAVGGCNPDPTFECTPGP